MTNLNAAVKDYPNVAAMKLQDILAKLGEMPEAIRTAVRNNAGGHANHSMFWEIMGPNGGTPDGELFAAITATSAASTHCKARFNDGGLRVFGSGWVMVTVDARWQARARDRPNQDTPIWMASVYCSAMTCGSTPITSRTRIGAPIPEGLVERGELEQDRRALCRRKGRNPDDLAIRAPTAPAPPRPRPRSC